MKQVNVHGSTMHYVVAGHGKPVLFVHGIPTSSYIWHHILPTVSEKAQCIALDLIGMGHSDKPKIAYTIDDHLHYFSGFIEALNLSDITLVLHGWGSVIGLTYAMRHPEKIKSLVLIESYVRLPQSLADIPLPVYELMQLAKEPERAKRLVIDENYLVEKILPGITLKHLSAEELDIYRKPFVTKESRQVLWQFVQEQPHSKPDSQVSKYIADYSAWLQKTDIPKLMMYAVPGFLTPIATVAWAKQHLPQLQLVDLGEGLHFLPITCAAEVAKALANWRHL